MRRDDPDVFQLGPPADLPAPPEQVAAALGPLVTEARLGRIRSVIAARKRSVVPVLEGLTDPHNGSAVLRTADALGLSAVHVVRGQHGFMAAHRVARGSHRWLDVIIHRSAGGCADALHREGYEIFVAVPDGDLAPEQLAPRPRVALVFGNEHAGASEKMREAADGTFRVPMVGFVESLNVSVAAAIAMYAASRDRPADLSEGERLTLEARFLMASVTDAEQIVREYLRRA